MLCFRRTYTPLLLFVFLGSRLALSQSQAVSAVPWEALRIIGLGLKADLDQGAVIRAHMRVIQMQLTLGGSSSNAAKVGDQIAVIESLPAVSGDNDPSLTAPILPMADKLLQAIDEGDSAAVGSDLQQLNTSIGALHKERVRRNLASMAGTKEGAFFELQARLDHSLHVNEVAKSVVLATELQSMLDDMVSRHEYIANYAFNHYEINDALGRASFLRGDYSAAGDYLQKAADIPPDSLGTINLDYFGPNLWLADQLLRVGKRDMVLKFLQTCRERFWIHDGMEKPIDGSPMFKVGNLLIFYLTPRLTSIIWRIDVLCHDQNLQSGFVLDF